MAITPEPAPTRRLAALLIALAIALTALAVLLVLQRPAGAASHREAPLISTDPMADNTDVFVFISPDNPGRIVLAASWIPFEGPEAGPNYFHWDDNVQYSIHIDNNGDAEADIRYTLTSKKTIGDPDTFLYNTGPIDSLRDPEWNLSQVITVSQHFTDVAPVILLDGVPTAPANIGGKSTPDYQALFDAATYTVNEGGDEIKIFAGMTDDPFWVDLQIFDLLTLRGQPPPVGYGNPDNVPLDSLSGFNVHSFVLEMPIDRLTQGSEPVIGVWATSRRQSTRVLSDVPGQPPQYSGSPVQVSRLGNPLVNEVVLPLALKDTFNQLKPVDDFSLYLDPTLGPVMQQAIEDPELARLLCALYGIPLPADSDDNCSTEHTPGTPLSGRADLFHIFMAGMVLQQPLTIETGGGPMTLPAGFNINLPQTVVPAEMIRINTALQGTICAPTPNPLGVLGGDICGFPNGRRVIDDVIDIKLLAVAGAAYELLDDRDSSFTFDASLMSVLGDGLSGNDVPFSNDFPYLAPPQRGANHTHRNIVTNFAPLLVKPAQNLRAQAAERPLAAAAVSFSGSALLLLPALVWWRRRRDGAPFTIDEQ